MLTIVAMPGSEALALELSDLTRADTGLVETRQFPDGESYVRIQSEVAGRDVWIACVLAPPEPEFLPLVFAARTIRALGAKRVGFIAPYLPYMRQDRAFHEGEALTSSIFADLISREFDQLVTVDPHLHRYPSLDVIYKIPTCVIHMASTIGSWIKENVQSPIIFGPDLESAQWANQIARSAGAPCAVFEKARLGDRDVRLSPPDLETWLEHTPVLVDDIISSGATMIEAIKILAEKRLPAPYCIAVHALFDDDTASELKRMTRALVTSDTIPNAYSRFQIAPLIAHTLVSQQ